MTDQEYLDQLRALAQARPMTKRAFDKLIAASFSPEAPWLVATKGAVSREIMDNPSYHEAAALVHEAMLALYEIPFVQDELLTVADAAAALGISDRAVRAAIKRGTLQATRGTGRNAPWLIPQAEVDAYTVGNTGPKTTTTLPTAHAQPQEPQAPTPHEGEVLAPMSALVGRVDDHHYMRLEVVGEVELERESPQAIRISAESWSEAALMTRSRDKGRRVLELKPAPGEQGHYAFDQWEVSGAFTVAATHYKRREADEAYKAIQTKAKARREE